MNSLMSSVGNSTNIFWHECAVGNTDRQKLINQKGCLVWITGLSGSGKSTLACSLGRELHSKGKLSYILDGDNLRHGLNKNLGFSAEDRAENIRRVERPRVTPREDENRKRNKTAQDANILVHQQVFMNMPLEVCEERDAKGLYKLARAGKIKGFTGIDDPYEPPLHSEIELKMVNGICPTPSEMAGQVASYLDEKGFLHHE
ncbi:hypothetical protein KSS87_017471 [Heliosperma pusillum]|nr:hypothetical protein KSS87_017471 [Heliosperma pusillum]